MSLVVVVGSAVALIAARLFVRCGMFISGVVGIYFYFSKIVCNVQVSVCICVMFEYDYHRVNPRIHR